MELYQDTRMYIVWGDVGSGHTCENIEINNFADRKNSNAEVILFRLGKCDNPKFDF